MGKFVVIIPIIIFIFFIVILLLFKNKNATFEKNEKIESFTKELFTIIDNLKNSKCITKDIFNMNNTIKNNNIEAERIFIELASNSSSPSIIEKYKYTYKKYINIYSTLKDCTEYCFQGDISTGNCICPKEFPFPIQQNNKVYCYEEDCTKIPNSTFIPSLTKDPSQNKCICNDGYVKDANNKFQCKKIINCLMSDWEYGNCDSATGYKYKSRKVLVLPENGGLECPSNLKKIGDTETVLSDVKCPVDCVLNDWSSWSKCDPIGTQTRNTTVKYSNKNGGASCPPLSETQKCSYSTGVLTTSGDGTFITNGNYNQVVIEIVGPGGNGGNGISANNAYTYGGGGGAGESRRIILNYSDVSGKPYNYSIGDISTQFSVNNQTYIANKGKNGANASLYANGAGGVGGTGGTGGELIVSQGPDGISGNYTSYGGNSIFASGGLGGFNGIYFDRKNASGPGAGGGGSCSRDYLWRTTRCTNPVGGTGRTGGVRITYI